MLSSAAHASDGRPRLADAYLTYIQTVFFSTSDRYLYCAICSFLRLALAAQPHCSLARDPDVLDAMQPTIQYFRARLVLPWTNDPLAISPPERDTLLCYFLPLLYSAEVGFLSCTV